MLFWLRSRSMRSKVVKWSMASASAGESGMARRIQGIQDREGTGLEARFVCHGKVHTHGKAMGATITDEYCLSPLLWRPDSDNLEVLQLFLLTHLISSRFPVQATPCKMLTNTTPSHFPLPDLQNPPSSPLPWAKAYPPQHPPSPTPQQHNHQSSPCHQQSTKNPEDPTLETTEQKPATAGHDRI